jgi:hypothetical protein
MVEANDLAVVRLSAMLEADFVRRGIFESARGREAIVAKTLLQQMLADAEAQRNSAPGPSLKRSYRHFKRQLEGLLQTPEHLRRTRMEEMRRAASKRAQEWADALAGDKVVEIAREMHVRLSRVDRERLVLSGLLGKVPVRREVVLQALDALDEIELEGMLGSYCGRDAIATADSLIERAAARG